MITKRFKLLLTAAFSLFCILFSNVAFSNEDTTTHSASTEIHDTAKHHEEAEFNVAETIMEHIQDDYSWHLFGNTSISLPVIIYSDKGLDIFSSKNLLNEHHQPVVYNSKYSYKLFEGKLRVAKADGSLDEEATAKIWDFSITKNAASLLISVAVLLLIFISVGNAYKKTGVTSAPKGLQSFIEPIIVFVRDNVAKPAIGHHYGKYMPFLLTIFFLILINNFMGLLPFLPGGANLSGNIAFTMTLAVIVFIVVNINGNKDYWKHIFWMPNMPIAIKIFLAPIELVGVFVKPVSLMIRLFANITAGHVLVLSLVCLIFIFKTIYASAIAVPFAVFISLIECLVAFLQAYIFTMLSAMYIGMATAEHEHH
jgi:F-type H+-transporting ATPase subunit a